MSFTVFASPSSGLALRLIAKTVKLEPFLILFLREKKNSLARVIVWILLRVSRTQSLFNRWLLSGNKAHGTNKLTAKGGAKRELRDSVTVLPRLLRKQRYFIYYSNTQSPIHSLKQKYWFCP